MLRRAPWLVALLLAGALLSTSRSACSADAVPVRTADAVRAWHAAREAGDAKWAQRIARTRHLDPTSMGARIVAEGLRAQAPAFDREPVVKALRALRTDAGDRVGLEGLARLIARMEAADMAALRREYRHGFLVERMRSLDLATEAGRRAARGLYATLRAEGAVEASYPRWRMEHMLGQAHRHAGELAAAVAAFDRAATYARAGGMHVPAARSAYAAAMLALGAKDLPGAVERGERSLASARRAEEPRGVREALRMLGDSQLQAGQPQAVARLIATAGLPPESWERHERHRYFVLAYNLQSQVNQPAASLVTAQHMHANAVALGDPAALADALRSVGHATHAVGKLGEAIQSYEAALALDLSARPRLERLVRVDLAEIWNMLGRFEDAEASARRALTLSQAAGRRADAAQDLLQLARSLGGQERWDEALRTAHKALETSIASGVLQRMGEARRDVAVLHWRAGEHTRAFALLELSRADFAARADASGEAYTLWLTGAYRVLRRDFDAALVLAERSAALLHPAHEFHSRVSRLRAAALHGLRRYREAVAAAHEAVESRRRVLEGLAESDAIALQRSVAGAAGFGLLSAHQMALQSEGAAAGRWVDEAFWMIESSRAVQLSVALRDARAGSLAVLSEELVQAERSSQEAVSKAHARLVRTAVQSATAKEQVAQARAALDEAWRERDRVVARIERVSRRAAASVSARPTTREKLAGLLREDEAWIAWAAAKDRMLALCVRRNTRVVVDVGPLAAIDADVARWRRALGTPGANDIEVARRLHETLIGPLRPYLGGTRRLLVSPEGSLASVPLGALVTPAGPKPRRLVESVEVLHVPSATSYAILVGDAPSKPTGGALITVAAPNYEGTGLPALPHAAREAGLVARPFQAERRVRFHGDKAALGPLLQYLEASAGSLRALHVAAHAFTDPEHPERNGIVLARGEMLSVDRVRRLRMPCDLVVLSCCDSARGTPTAGEGHRGLVRAFLLAGARRVIASCWRVADAETPALMGHLYKAWETEGLSASAALRAAQLERLRAGGKLAHPYYWAPFVAWGLP